MSPDKSASPVIAASNLSKTFRSSFRKKKLAVRDLSFCIHSGQVVGLLGPNGSGKSTTLKMILGFLRPSRGEVFVCGKRSDTKQARSFIGYLPENPRFQKFLSGESVLEYYGRLHSLEGVPLRKRIDYLLELVDLKNAAQERIRAYSKGMVQRLAIAQALLSKARLLIFDEPMSGLDPVGRMDIRKLIWQIHEEFPTAAIFFSSHILGDVEELCDSVMLLNEGKLVKNCSMEELIGKEAEQFEVTVSGLSLEQLGLGSDQVRKTALGVSFSVHGVDSLGKHLDSLRAKGARILGVHSQRQRLESALFGRATEVKNQEGHRA